jgi:hypothetical protein
VKTSIADVVAFVAVISPDVFIILAVKVCPVGIVIPAFADINPDADIVIADIFAVPFSANDCPVGIIIPAFAYINPTASIVFVVFSLNHLHPNRV